MGLKIQPAFACSKLTLETIEQNVKYVHKSTIGWEMLFFNIFI